MPNIPVHSASFVALERFEVVMALGATVDLLALLDLCGWQGHHALMIQG